MKIFVSFLIFCVHLSFAFCDLSAIDFFIDKINPNVVVSVEIRDIDSGKVIYERNPRLLLRPASLEKIPAALVALSQLGKSYQFETSLLGKGSSVYLRFSGDPTFTLDNLVSLLKAYKKKKGSTIAGDIFINQEKVPVSPYRDGWSVEAIRFVYGAPISVVSVNKNTVCFKLVPADIDRKKPEIIYDKNQPPYKIDNHSVSMACSEEDYIERCDLDFEDAISIKGCVPKGSPAFKICLPVKEHRFKEYISRCIQAALTEAGVRLKGKIIFRSFPKEQLPVLAQHLSLPLKDILKKGVKDSDDTIMEAVLLPLMMKSPEKFRKNKNFNDFMAKVLRDALSVDMSQAIFMDGSGLSHHNLISAHHLGEILLSVLKHQSLKKNFLEVMAQGGKDGTLKIRFKTLPKDIKVLAKTGTLTGIRGLAGYVLKNEKPKYLFVLMMQNFSEDGKIYEGLQDKIVTYLAQSAI